MLVFGLQTSAGVGVLSHGWVLAETVKRHSPVIPGAQRQHFDSITTSCSHV